MGDPVTTTLKRDTCINVRREYLDARMNHADGVFLGPIDVLGKHSVWVRHGNRIGAYDSAEVKPKEERKSA